VARISDIRRVLLMVGRVVPVHVFKRLDGHSQEAGSLPDRDAGLHHPRRAGVPQRVLRDAGQLRRLDDLAPSAVRIFNLASAGMVRPREVADQLLIAVEPLPALQVRRDAPA
jgi:hypothetical protein